jgi:hypothetical protein
MQIRCGDTKVCCNNSLGLFFILTLVIATFSKCKSFRTGMVYSDNKSKEYFYFQKDCTFLYHQKNYLYGFENFCRGNYEILKDKIIIKYEPFKSVTTKVAFLLDKSANTDSVRIVLNVDKLISSYPHLKNDFQILINNNRFFGNKEMGMQKIDKSTVSTIRIFSTFAANYISEIIKLPQANNYNVVEIYVSDFSFFQYGTPTSSSTFQAQELINLKLKNSLVSDTMTIKSGSIVSNGFKYRKRLFFSKKQEDKLRLGYFSDKRWVKEP